PSWLPQPAQWAELSVAAQTGDWDSTLEMYRTALELRRLHPALGAGSEVTWLDAPDGVLAFRRDGAPGEQGFVCVVNLTSQPVTIPSPGKVLLSSGADVRRGQANDGDSSRTSVIAADTTVWWAI
ncbi:MAG: DUF3459 domain-containing protein, partial [Actinomycetia bacterium]|nr:DUF3459 domain-containing protein [Actinomycetes bacterium]